MTESKNNSNIDIITGDPKAAILKLSWPMMVSMFMIASYNLADSIWLAGLGPNALAALGFITPLFFVMIGIGNGIGAGANSLIARSIGANDKKTADNAALHALLFTLIMSIVVPIILLPFLKDILIFMGAGDSIQAALDYGYITFGLIFAILFSVVLSAILRSEGDVKRARDAIIVTAVVNIVIDPILIYVVGWGMAGAAIASIISSLLSCLVMIYWIWGKKDTYLSLQFSSFKFKFNIMKDIFNVAIPASAENLVLSFLGLVMNAMFVIIGGITAVAVYTSGMRILQMFMIPLIGLGTAVLTVSAAAYGAGNYKKLEISFNYTIKLGLLISGILALIMFIFAPQIALIFTYNASTAVLADQIIVVIRVLALFLLSIPVGIVASMTFQGVGKGFTSLIITTFRSLIFEAVFAYLFGIVFGWGLVGMYFGLVFGCALGAVLGFTWAKLFLKNYKKDIIDRYGHLKN